MTKLSTILKKLRQTQKNIKYDDLCKICDFYFGDARQTSGSHKVYKTPWQGDPRVNIQNHKGKAKTYQVKQIIRALDRLEVEKNAEE